MEKKNIIEKRAELRENKNIITKSNGNIRDNTNNSIKNDNSGNKINIIIIILILGAVFAINIFKGDGNAEEIDITISSAENSQEVINDEKILTEIPAFEQEIEIINIGGYSAPNITILYPINKTINESTPRLDIYINGSEIDTVWVSVDGGQNVTIGHMNGSINYVRLNPFFAEDFSKRNIGLETSNSNIIEGKLNCKSEVIWDRFVFTDSLSHDDFFVNFDIEVSKKFSDPLLWLVFRGMPGFKEGIAIGLGGWNKEFIISEVISPNLARLVGYNGQMQKTTPKEYSFLGIFNGTEVTLRATDLSNPSIFSEATFSEASYLSGNSIWIENRDTESFIDNLILYKELSNGQHSVTIYANNSAGYIGRNDLNFIVNYSKTEIFYSIGDTITKGSFAVTLNQFTPNKELLIASGLYASSEINYAMADITIENVKNSEQPVVLDSLSVIIDDNSNQYEFKKLNRYEEIKQTKLYPKTKATGKLYFTPGISINANKLKLIIKLDGVSYEFDLKAY